MKPKIKLLVVDDHKGIREATRILMNTNNDFEYLYTDAENGLEMTYEKTHIILGEGNFVLAVSEGKFGKGEATTFYDADMITGLINAMLGHAIRNSAIDRVTPAEI